MKLEPRFIRFVITGVINTIAGYGTIILLIRIGIVPEISNVIGYIFGFCISFLLNRNWVFRAQNQVAVWQGIRFLCAFAIAYALNLATLSFFYRIIGIPPIIAQGFATVVYSITFYLLNKRLTFSDKHNKP